MMAPEAQVAMYSLAAGARVAFGDVAPCPFCFGHRVRYDTIEIQIKHDRACQARTAPLGARWANAPMEE